MDCCCCWNSWNVWAGVRQECERYMHSLVDAIILCLLTHSEIASSCFEYLSTLFLSHNRSFALSFTRNMCCASLILVFFLLNSASHCVFTESENWKFTYGNKKKKKIENSYENSQTFFVFSSSMSYSSIQFAKAANWWIVMFVFFVLLLCVFFLSIMCLLCHRHVGWYIHE